MNFFKSYSFLNVEAPDWLYKNLLCFTSWNTKFINVKKFLGPKTKQKQSILKKIFKIEPGVVAHAYL